MGREIHFGITALQEMELRKKELILLLFIQGRCNGQREVRIQEWIKSSLRKSLDLRKFYKIPLKAKEIF